MPDHKTGTREEWLAARLELLKAEKGLTRLPSTEVTGSVFFYIDESGNSGNNLFDR
jgi:predicted dithiol-disulfide oxidoreductase (DUF899 family)